jgi:hypothetical protein
MTTTQKSFPKISIVTPSFNQAPYLEETIRSVLDQNYPNLEYVVVDGGSTDGSVSIIRKYESRLAWWVSEPDGGHYAGLNKGFAHTTGEVMGWVNSDDKLLPWTFKVLADVMRSLPQIEWVTSRFHLFWDEDGKVTNCEEHPGFSSELVLRGGTLPGCGWPAWGFIQQESTFWRRSLWQRAGAELNGAKYSLAGDFELWMRFARLSQLYSLSVPLGGFRRHAAQKTASQMPEYLNQARAAFVANGGQPPGLLRGYWLKNYGKVARYLRRRHAFASAQQGCRNILEFQTREHTWAAGDR